MRSPARKTGGCASEKLQWLKMVKASNRSCKVAPSLSFVFFNSQIFQMLIPGLPKLLHPTPGKVPNCAHTYRAFGFCATWPAASALPPGQPGSIGALLVIPPHAYRHKVDRAPDSADLRRIQNGAIACIIGVLNCSRSGIRLTPHVLSESADLPQMHYLRVTASHRQDQPPLPEVG